MAVRSCARYAIQQLVKRRGEFHFSFSRGISVQAARYKPYGEERERERKEKEGKRVRERVRKRALGGGMHNAIKVFPSRRKRRLRSVGRSEMGQLLAKVHGKLDDIRRLAVDSTWNVRRLRGSLTCQKNDRGETTGAERVE